MVARSNEAFSACETLRRLIKNLVATAATVAFATSIRSGAQDATIPSTNHVEMPTALTFPPGSPDLVLTAARLAEVPTNWVPYQLIELPPGSFVFTNEAGVPQHVAIPFYRAWIEAAEAPQPEELEVVDFPPGTVVLRNTNGVPASPEAKGRPPGVSTGSEAEVSTTGAPDEDAEVRDFPAGSLRLIAPVRALSEPRAEFETSPVYVRPGTGDSGSSPPPREIRRLR